jgi:hypothetical protein
MTTIDPPLLVTDDVLLEVRRHKVQIAQDFHFDVVALGLSLQNRQVGDPRFPKAKSEQTAPRQLPLSDQFKCAIRNAISLKGCVSRQKTNEASETCS